MANMLEIITNLLENVFELNENRLTACLMIATGLSLSDISKRPQLTDCDGYTCILGNKPIQTLIPSKIVDLLLRSTTNFDSRAVRNTFNRLSGGNMTIYDVSKLHTQYNQLQIIPKLVTSYLKCVTLTGKADSNCIIEIIDLVNL